MIGWIPAVSLADARGTIADDYPIRPMLWLVDDLLYRDILPRSRIGIIYASDIYDAGTQVGGIQLDSSNLFTVVYILYVCNVWIEWMICVFGY